MSNFPFRRNEQTDLSSMHSYYQLKYQILKEDYEKKVKEKEETEKKEQKRMLEDMQRKVSKLERKKKKLEGTSESEEEEKESDSEPEDEKINVSLAKGRKDIRAKSRKTNPVDYIAAAKQLIEDTHK
jgi:hypothetical protein